MNPKDSLIRFAAQRGWRRISATDSDVVLLVKGHTNLTVQFRYYRVDYAAATGFDFHTRIRGGLVAIRKYLREN